MKDKPEPEQTEKEPETFRERLDGLINEMSLDSQLNTPDYILAEYVEGCLDVFDRTIKARDQWFGTPGGGQDGR